MTQELDIFSLTQEEIRLLDLFLIDLFDQCKCPRCGTRSKLKKEVYPTIHQDRHHFACTLCDSLVEDPLQDEEIPF